MCHQYPDLGHFDGVSRDVHKNYAHVECRPSTVDRRKKIRIVLGRCAIGYYTFSTYSIPMMNDSERGGEVFERREVFVWYEHDERFKNEKTSCNPFLILLLTSLVLCSCILLESSRNFIRSWVIFYPNYS